MKTEKSASRTKISPQFPTHFESQPHTRISTATAKNTTATGKNIHKYPYPGQHACHHAYNAHCDPFMVQNGICTGSAATPFATNLSRISLSRGLAVS